MQKFTKLFVFNVTFIFIFISIFTCSKTSNGRSTKFVDDRYGLLTKKEVDQINRYNEVLLRDYDIQLMVNILEQSPEDINDFAANEFTEYLLGNLTKGAKGVLFIVDPTSKLVRIEIGYDLEAFYTDVFISYIEQAQMAPFFEENKIAFGILASIEMLVTRANEFYNNEPFSDITTTLEKENKDEYLSGGAGAKAAIDIGAGKRKTKKIKNPERYSAQPTPMLAFLRRIELLQMRNHDHDLGIYTPESREFFKNWTTTDAQCYNELRDMANAKSKPVCIIKDSFAVIKWSLSDKQCAPSFLRKDSTGWMYDIAAMNKNLGFDTRNHWRMQRQDHAFMFAFNDIYFDSFGRPYERPPAEEYPDRWIPSLKGIPSDMQFSGCKKLTNEERAKNFPNYKKKLKWLKKVGRKAGYYDFYVNRKRCNITQGIYSIYTGAVIHKNRAGAKESFDYYHKFQRNAEQINVGDDGYCVLWDAKSQCDASKKVRHIRLDFTSDNVNGYITVTILPGTFNDNKLVSFAWDLAIELEEKLIERMKKL